MHTTTAGAAEGRTTAAATLDTSGLLCPLPVYKASVALQKLAPGEVLELICTDPGSLADIPALARQAGHELLRTLESDGRQVFWIAKAGAASGTLGANEVAR